MTDFRIRCSSIGKIMTDPKTKADGILSVGAKTHVRELFAQDLFGVDFEVSSKYIEKGIEMESESIALFNRVRCLSLTKNSERRSNAWITGECDLFDAARRRGHDLKTSWSIQTFPVCEADCLDKLYEWQMRGYMWLWDADEWEVNYALVNTPDRLIGWEPPHLHYVDHIPEHHRLTTWVVRRDRSLEERIAEKVDAARAYYRQVIAEFERTHQSIHPTTSQSIAAEVGVTI